MAQSVERPTSARVTFTRFVSSSPASGLCRRLRVRSLLQILCFRLSLPLPCSCPVSHSLSKINLKKCDSVTLVTAMSELCQVSLQALINFS